MSVTTTDEALSRRQLLVALRAVRNGNFNARLPLDLTGIDGEIAAAFNDMAELNARLARELKRVGTSVGRDGRIGERVNIGDTPGAWADCLESVNGLIRDLTEPTAEINRVVGAVARGDLAQRMALDMDGRPMKGEFLRSARTINTMVDQLNAFASEVTRVAREVGTEGKLGGQADIRGVSGTWRDLTDSVNSMAGNLTAQVRNIAEVTTAVANGDLSKKITVDVRGEILELKNTINTMVDQLNAFASEVTRVAREVGTEGKLGGQAQVRGVSGTWRDLTDNVNQLAGNLTEQVRGIARVVTAVANGDLRRKLTVEAKGEVAELANTINNMIDTLATFAEQVSTVAREVGIEGKLGGQARVPGAAGTWRDLTDNVNQLAANLTTQVRAIGEVATAVTKGDLSRSIQVEVQGELEVLKDDINEMIGNLRETTRINADQDWLKTNLARFTGMLQGQKDLQTVGRTILSELAPLVGGQHGVFYLNEPVDGRPRLRLLAGYAYRERKHVDTEFGLGEGLVGQCAYERQRILLTQVPPDYITINSGLGEAPPLNIVVLPVLFENDIKAVIELASFNRFTEIHLSFLDQLMENIGIVLNTLSANMRTEELLKQSQALALELQQRQDELQQTNEELEEKARLLGEQNEEVERRRREVEDGRRALEQKAEQLALTSRYKSQFLANMSHELRTPLNSLLILSQQLADNPDGNLTERQVEFAQTIRSAGNDLLTLINDVLDLSKIESGTTAVSIGDVPFEKLVDDVSRTFRELANQKRLEFRIALDPQLPRAIRTDETRLQQVLKNLLSNAFKFTDTGSVSLSIAPATEGWDPGHETLDRAERVIAFHVADTGVGVPEDKHDVIFEAFQQADMNTSRRFGGTGLGLSISREIATLLGGDIRLRSRVGHGSTFTLYLPEAHEPPLAGVVDESRPAGRLALASNGAVGSADSHVALPTALVADNPFGDDRDRLGPGDRSLLIVEDDEAFARILVDVAHEHGYKALVALRGEAGLALARRYRPSAITLDLHLPELDGLNVLDLLKHDPATRHIPVHVISVRDEASRALGLGAIGHLNKPTSRRQLDEALAALTALLDRPTKRLLVVETDPVRREALVGLIGDADVSITAVASGREALAAVGEQRFDCVALDLDVPDAAGEELLATLKAMPGLENLPVVAYSERELSAPQAARLRDLAHVVTVGDGRSMERVLDETALFLHRAEADLPEPKRALLRAARRTDPVLAGKHVLIVDDDMRNIFAITSALERHAVETAYVEDGRAALDWLRHAPAVDAVLMDIMMPDMDGFETMRAIRADPRFSELPIIALTAKAMKGDRERCLEAGASDYITKPVDVEQLYSMLRVWLRR
jgi:signal transduction histidine kinase/DNA-binding response OmpR family regulator/HAMP domain-containing protein